MTEWADYQEEVAEFFRSLGLVADTNVCVTGVRTSHYVDVVVRSKHAGFDVTWLVECKAWRTTIPKEKVLALRSIVDDAGVDRGFIMAERGYQAGALEAARFANITLTSIADLRETLAYEIGITKLRSTLDRAESCRERYWAMNKSDRIDLGLRPPYGFPVKYDRASAALSANGGRGRDPVGGTEDGACEGPLELYAIVDAELGELERRLAAAEAVLRARAAPLAKP